MGKEKRGPLALELWAKQLVDGYPGVCVRNMTTSWRNGLAFCALIHRFRPDLIDYDKLDPADIIGNCSLAFEVAESKLGIPSLLDPLDMAALEIPDRLSVLTYVAQFYNAFKNLEAKSRPKRMEPDEDDGLQIENRSVVKQGSPSPEKKSPGKRKLEINENEIMKEVKRNMPRQSVLLRTSSECFECRNPVFISERVLFMKKLYHRSCFRCCNCKNPLNPHIVDVSSDGSLYCLEKTCHEELVKRIEQSSDPEKPPKLTKDNLQTDSKKGDATDSPNMVSQNAEEMNANAHAKSFPGGDPTQLNAQEAEPEKPHSSPSTSSLSTPKNTKKLMDFAGALLNVDQEDQDQSNEIESTEKDKNETANTAEERPGEETPREQDSLKSSSSPLIPEVKVTLEEDETQTESQTDVDEGIKGAKMAEDDTKDKPPVNTDSEGPNSTSSPVTLKDEPATITDVEGVSTPATEEEQVQTSTSQVPEKPEAEPVSNVTVVAPVEDDIRSHSPTEPEPEPAVITKSGDESPSGSNDQNPSNTFEEEEKGASSQAEVPASPVNAPSPIPRKRPPKPPPPKFSPTPVPLPRSLTKPAGDGNDDKSYPTELNPFGSDDDEENLPNRPEPKNPFEDDDDEDIPPTSPAPRSSTPNPEGISRPSVLPRSNSAKFNVPPPRPPPPHPGAKRMSASPAKPYNPFEDDEDDIGEYQEERPEQSSSLSRVTDDTGSISSKTSDLSSFSSAPTPTPRSLNTSDTEGTGSFKMRSRKSRRAPLPPSIVQGGQQGPPSSTDRIPGREAASVTPTTGRKVIPASPKLLKGLSVPKAMPSSPSTTIRKKRRAPPPKRRVEPLPEAAIKTEFEDLEVKMKELERQGITLETRIRELEKVNQEAETETEPTEAQGETVSEENAPPSNEDILDELMVQLWNIVNEKNDILRRQTELEYLRRGHSLEEMQAELEFKLRVLMQTPDDQKPPNYEDMEQALLQRLLKLVDERNEVVEWLDYHRQQEREEEQLVSQSITTFSNKPATPFDPNVAKSKEKKSKHKDEKEKKEGLKLKLGIFKKKSKKSKVADNTSED